MNWWEDLKYKRPLNAEQEQSVTDQARPVTYGFWGNSCVCEMCGRTFKSKRRVYGTKFCSGRCRQKHYRQTKKAEKA